jgi:alpha-mannosidase
MFMVRKLLRLPFLLMVCVVLSVAQNQTDKSSPPDLTKQQTLYVVGYAHLDTQWRWEYPQVIREYLSSTLHDNFNLFEKYPHYIFNFSGANRYRLMKEYYPSDYEKMKQYVAAGKWFPAGSSMEESDVNSPSAESIFRQVLYGNKYFRADFGKASAEYMLPDCFGFPASLPSILAHAGIKGFSTQKLTWGSSAPAGGPNSPERTPPGTPFNVGIWEGPDGKSVLAGLNPGSYSADITTDLSKPLPPSYSVTPPPNSNMTPEELELRRYQGDWARRVQRNGEVSGLWTDYHYYGTGDIGGSPREPAVKLLEAIITKSEAVLPAPRHPGEEQAPPAPEGAQPVRVGDGPVKVLSTKADQMFLDIKPSQTAKLPHYKGEMELTNHSAGSLSSETYHKRWNRKNELLADAAEKASIAAAWLGGPAYPLERLNNAWTLVMGGQFHDIQAGTATPKSYEFSWNDDVIAMNQFAGVLTTATEAVASGMDTQAKGTPIVVYNPLNIQREDVVEATVTFPNGTPKAVRVVGPDGREVPAQLSGSGDSAKVLFLAKAPSVGYAVYDVQSADSAPAAATLKVSESSLENARYRVTVNQNGDVAGIFDKSINKELLSSPIRLAFQTEHPFDWPAWNMDWEDQQKPPRGYVEGPAKIRIVENGPVRVALEISRQAEDSNFVQTISLAAGDAGNRVEFGNVIDWKAKEAALKATFPLTASNPQATYNWDIGTIQRGNNDPKKFEVASHQWFDLTDKSGAYGVTVLSDCKYGSDKPDDNTLRLTLVYTPGLGGGNGRSYSDQTTQDWGHHEFSFGLAGHRGDWKQAQTDWQGYRLNQPLIAFESSKHPGGQGKTFSLLNVSNSRVRVLATKKAEQGDDVIVRLVELDGKPAQNVRIGFAAPVVSAREVDGQEQPVGNATVTGGSLVATFTPYQLHTYAVKLSPARTKVAAVQSQAVTLNYDQAVATQQQSPSQSGFDAKGHSLPAEMLSPEISYGAIHFTLAPARDGKPNAVAAKGQTIQLPGGTFNRVYLLAASADGDQKAAFKVGDKSVDLTVQDWGGYIGQWDNRTWNKHQEPVPLRPGAPAPPPGAPPRMRTVLEYTGLTPGLIKRAPLAWYASHHHNPDGTDEPYAYSYLFVYPIELPPNARTLTLPDNDKIRILAITVANESSQLWPAQPLYDTLERTGSSSAQKVENSSVQMSKR